MDQTRPIVINNFAGGYCGNLSLTELGLNQAADLDNIVIKPGGLGFRSRLGNSKLNSTVLNSGANIQGIGYLLQADGDNWLVAVAGAKFYASSSISGTFSDVTGTASITAGVGNIWDFVTFNDSVIGFGGSPTSPDAPFSWSGTGTAAALGGSPPAAYGAFSANNRVFAFRTGANPSTIYWSIIGSATDWSGSGSGSAVVGSLSDNQKITGAAILSTNYVLIFKENSTYQMVISSNPFPIYTLFDSVGCVGKQAWVNVDGEVYFITGELEMKSTNGEELRHYPPTADNLWRALDPALQTRITGFRQKGADYDHLVWLVRISSGSEAKYAIVWDLLNKCWLRHTTGHSLNTALTVNFTSYCGGFDGYIYKMAQSATYADASEAAPGTIAAYWRSGWVNPSIQNEIVQVAKFLGTYKTKASGSITVNYGFDFNADSKSFTLSQVATGSEVYTSRMSVLTGRGNFFQFKIGLSSSTIDMDLASITMRGKVYGQKRISA